MASVQLVDGNRKQKVIVLVEHSPNTDGKRVCAFLIYFLNVCFFKKYNTFQRLLLYPAHNSSTQALAHFFFLWSMNDHANAQASMSVMAIRRVYNGMMIYIF